MRLQIRPELQHFLDQKVKSGEYASADAVIEAGLASLQQQERCGDFVPGELDEILAEGEADIRAGRVVDGEQAFAALDAASSKRRKGATK